MRRLKSFPTAAARGLLAAAALALAACEGSYVTDPDDFPGDNAITILSVSVPSGSLIEVDDRVAVLVRYRARQRSELQAHLVSDFGDLGQSPAVRVGPGRGEEELVVTADRIGDVELIEVVLGDPRFNARIYDRERLRWRLLVR
jgi:hypothetical protein